MTEERYKQIKDSIELQSLVRKQMRVEDELLQEEIELLKAYEKLKVNWNKLKSWADYMHVNTLQQNNYGRILEKMQELEQGSDSNE